MLGFKEYSLTSFELLLRARMKNYFLYELGPILPNFFVGNEFFYDDDGKELSLEEGMKKAFDEFNYVYAYDRSFSTGPATPTSLISIPNNYIGQTVNGVPVEDLIPNSFRNIISFGKFDYYKLAAEYLVRNNIVPDIGFKNEPWASVSLFRELSLMTVFFKEFYLFLKEINFSSLSSNSSVNDDFNFIRKSAAFAAAGANWIQLVLLPPGGSGTIEKNAASNKIKLEQFLRDTVFTEINPCCTFKDFSGYGFDVDEGFFGDTFVERLPAGGVKGQEESNYIFRLSDIHTAIVGTGTNEKKLFDTIDEMTTAEKCHFCQRNRFYFKDQNSSLMAAVESDLSGDELEKFYEKLNCEQFGYGKKGSASIANKNAPPGSFIREAFSPTDKDSPIKCKGTDKINYVEQYKTASSAFKIGLNYRFFTLREAVNQVNINIDDNLVSIVDGV